MGLETLFFARIAVNAVKYLLSFFHVNVFGTNIRHEKSDTIPFTTTRLRYSARSEI